MGEVKGTAVFCYNKRVKLNGLQKNRRHLRPLVFCRRGRSGGFFDVATGLNSIIEV